MLASRVLPPIRSSSPPPPPPLATFFSVPRRYVKSNMQVGDDNSPSPTTEEGKSGRNLRKSSRIHIPRTAPSSCPVQHTKEEEQPTPTSPQAARKRNASIEIDDRTQQSVESESPTDVKTPASAVSAGSGDLSPHVCLCQPEPKIPRPRNGKCLILC